MRSCQIGSEMPFFPCTVAFVQLCATDQLAIFLLEASRPAWHLSMCSRSSLVQSHSHPLLMLFCCQQCVIKLLHVGISLQEPEKVKLATDVEVAVFAKTKTSLAASSNYDYGDILAAA